MDDPFYPADDLTMAVMEKNETFVLQLLESGEDPTLDDSEVLWEAVLEQCNENIINSLLQYGARANFRILNLAVRKCNETIIEKLLQHGADAKEFDDYDNTNCLHTVSRVCGEAASKICEVLIKYGAEVDQQIKTKRTTPLQIATYEGNDRVVEVLLQYGAQPCREFDPSSGMIKVALEFCFSLKASTIESMIKYAALQVNSKDESEVQKFFQFVTNAQDSRGFPVPDIGQKYLKFARDCMEEANILREKILNEDGVTLLDFVLSQRDLLESYKGNSNIVNRVLDHITSTPFPIYREIVFKKLERNMIISKLLKSQHSQWCYILEGRKCFVNTDCIKHIATYLSAVVDLGNLLIALNSAF